MFAGFYAGRRVLVTGHTGFKGAWLCQWLLDLGAEVSGLALAPSTEPSLFHLLGLAERIDHREVDIRDAEAVQAAVADIRPEVVLHLAAQPLVRESYADPVATWGSNVMGTVHVLEAVRACPGVKSCVVVSSDKCYENREQVWGYRECDPMGGHDPYSASKGATELVAASYRRSFFGEGQNCAMASARAGNVIGGGDWAKDRIVVDFVQAIAAGQTLGLRNPQATRPWQHVLEPLSGYLWLAARLFSNGQAVAGGWNFGPGDANVVTVDVLARGLVAAWGSGEVTHVGNADQPHEAGLLKLDCSKARQFLGWQGVWDVKQTVAHTVAWYKHWHAGLNPVEMTDEQLHAYQSDAQAIGLDWTQ